jgi:uncharacterized membrane protein (DUF4010 family)
MHFDFHQIINGIPKEFINFVLVTLFSLIIGLSQRKIHHSTNEHNLFGTDRTFTFIGILGYLLLIADRSNYHLYIAGGTALTVFLTVYYISKIKNFSDFGLTTILIALLTYCIPLILLTQPLWLFLLVIITVLIFTELKHTFSSITEKFDRHEFVTLTKFIIMAGLILPIVPDTPLIPFLPLTPFKTWLAVVVISSISYISYLLKKFVFKDAGIIISGILGGFYSSTATTVVLARKLRGLENGKYQYMAAIILATAMMYLRVLILVAIFNNSLFRFMLPAFAILITISILVAIILLYRTRKLHISENVVFESDSNPLEFKVAIIFTSIFILFTFLTQFAVQQYGSSGLSILSFIVGIVDIDPFLLNIFQGKYEVSTNLIAVASFQAIISNNIAKLAYACFFAGQKHWKMITFLFSIVIGSNIILIFTL